MDDLVPDAVRPSLEAPSELWGIRGFASVTFVDRGGVEILKSLAAEDVEIINCCAFITDLLNEELGAPTAGDIITMLHERNQDSHPQANGNAARDGYHRLFSPEQWVDVVRDLSLSPRESQIVYHLLDDATEDAIAIKLGISVHTVHTYLGRLYAKLSVSSRAACLVRVFEAYLIQQYKGHGDINDGVRLTDR